MLMRIYPQVGDTNDCIPVRRLVRQSSRNASTTLTMPGDVLRKVFLEFDMNAAMQAFMSGQIKAAGDMTKLMALQTARPSAEQKALFQQVLAIS